MLSFTKKNIDQLASSDDMLFPIFYTTKFLKKKENEGLKVSVIDFLCNNELIARLVYDEITKTSLPRSPFGGIYFLTNNKKNISIVYELILDLRLIKIVFPPDVYGFSGKYTSLNGYKEINDYTVYLPLNDNYYSKLEASERTRFNKCKKAGFLNKKLDSEDLPKVYNLILEAKESKGYRGTMSLFDLSEMFVLFPNDFQIFGCYNNEELIAGVVNIRVSNKIFYNFYVGDSLSYRNFSPLVFLFQEVYDYAKDQGGLILDLGLSSVDGQLNNGLHKFKLKLGGKVSFKKTFIKE